MRIAPTRTASLIIKFYGERGGAIAYNALWQLQLAHFKSPSCYRVPRPYGYGQVIGNPSDDWNLQQELNDYMQHPPNHPGALADRGSARLFPHRLRHYR